LAVTGVKVGERRSCVAAGLLLLVLLGGWLFEAFEACVALAPPPEDEEEEAEEEEEDAEEADASVAAAADTSETLLTAEASVAVPSVAEASVAAAAESDVLEASEDEELDAVLVALAAAFEDEDAFFCRFWGCKLPPTPPGFWRTLRWAMPIITVLFGPAPMVVAICMARMAFTVSVNTCHYKGIIGCTHMEVA
jgi:hypothetical protein